MNRRSFLLGLGAVVAPAVIRIPGLLMPVRALVRPDVITGLDLGTGPDWTVVSLLRFIEESRLEMDKICGIPNLQPARPAAT